MNLRLSLKRNWFEMTKADIKKEDYREITPYWCSRLMLRYGCKASQSVWANRMDDFFLNSRAGGLKEYIRLGCAEFVRFDFNIMTLGYPSSTDLERIIKLKHCGIEIRTGNPAWGAEPDKFYFVIKHGEIYGE